MKSSKYQKAITTLCLTLIIFTLPGCMSWTSGWKKFEKPSLKGDVYNLIAESKKQIAQADNKAKLLELINTYEHVLKIDPKHREALAGLGSYCLLVGYGYSDTKREKEKYFLKALQYNEQLMYLNPKFAALIDKGNNLWEACDALTKNEMEAMFFWYAAGGVYWKDCLNALEKIVNIQWPFRAKMIMTRMMEIDPTWQHGSPYYCWANYYAAVPGFLGGDMEKAEEYYKKAIELGPNMLNFRRTRAKFFHTKNNDKKSFKEDLTWVISQDPHKAGLSYPWNAFIQRDAQEGLDHIDDYF